MDGNGNLSDTIVFNDSVLRSLLLRFKVYFRDKIGLNLII